MHFLAGGALLFLLYGLVNTEEFIPPDEIIVDDTTVSALSAGFSRTWQRVPNPSELQGLVDNWIREEILYREGLTMRLDENDVVIRRRVAQKVEFIAEGMISLQPEEADLEQWLAEHPEDYRVPATYSLRQIYFDPGRHGDKLDAVLVDALTNLVSGKASYSGDSTLLPERLDNISADAVERVIGARFATALSDLPVGEWTGPVDSDYGVHLVYVESAMKSRLPSIDEVRDDVERDLVRAMTEESNTAFYATLRDAYTVTITANLPSPDTAD